MASAMLRRTSIGFVRRINNGYALASVCLTMEASKACTKCGLIKPLGEFALDKRVRNGRKSYCLECQRVRSRVYNQSYLRSGRRAESRRANPQSLQLSTMLNSSKKRAREKNLDHDIDLAYLRSIAPSHCPYLGVELRWEVQNGLGVKARTFPNSPSLDRIDSSKGYVRGNVAIVSHRANCIKNDATEQELIEMGQRIAQLKMQLACEDMH